MNTSDNKGKLFGRVFGVVGLPVVVVCQSDSLDSPIKETDTSQVLCFAGVAPDSKPQVPLMAEFAALTELVSLTKEAKFNVFPIRVVEVFIADAYYPDDSAKRQN